MAVRYADGRRTVFINGEKVKQEKIEPPEDHSRGLPSACFSPKLQSDPP